MNEALVGLTLLAAREGEKHEAMELGVLIALPVVLAVILFRIANGRVANGAPAWQRWAGLVPLLVGIWLSFDPFNDIRMESYRSFHDVSDRSISLHYATLFVPAAVAVLMAGYILYLAHRDRMEG